MASANDVPLLCRFVQLPLLDLRPKSAVPKTGWLTIVADPEDVTYTKRLRALGTRKQTFNK